MAFSKPPFHDCSQNNLFWEQIIMCCFFASPLTPYMGLIYLGIFLCSFYLIRAFGKNPFYFS